MTRLQADLALGLVGVIWGFGFVSQKDALDHLGPLTFIALRFFISAFFILPLVMREGGLARLRPAFAKARNRNRLLGLSVAFAGGVILQQVGQATTTVTNAAFITSLYIVMVPWVGRMLFGDALSSVSLLAGVMSVAGIALLSSNGSVATTGLHLSFGDFLIVLCAICFALQVTLLGKVVQLAKAPFTLSFVLYLAVGGTALLGALLTEGPGSTPILAAWKSILFSGIVAGAIGYTVQAVAQQHTPPADTAIILSTEALFGGVGGVWLLGEKLTPAGIIGCVTIMAAVVLVELGPQFKKRRRGAVAKTAQKG